MDISSDNNIDDNMDGGEEVDMVDEEVDMVDADDDDGEPVYSTRRATQQARARFEAMGPAQQVETASRKADYVSAREALINLIKTPEWNAATPEEQARMKTKCLNEKSADR